MDCYEQVLGKQSDDLGDIATNLMACSANQFDQIERVDHILSKVTMTSGISYEYCFNKSQMLMKKGAFDEALDSLLRSFELAHEDGSDVTDAARFKVQEYHMLNSLLVSGFSQVQYKPGSKFTLPGIGT